MADENPDLTRKMVAELRQTLEEYYQLGADSRGEEFKLDRKLHATLKALGYID